MCGNNFLILVFLLGIIIAGLIFFSKRKPLDSFDNSSKSDKYDKEEFIKFLQLKGLY